MNREEWDKNIKKSGLLKPRENQFEYYKRVEIFWSDDNKILINPAGMGLGKTYATAVAIMEHLKDSSYVFIATPIGAIKNEWSRELKKVGLDNREVVWISKPDCCVIKRKNNSFNVNDCIDDCFYRCELNPNGKYSFECEFLFKEIQEQYPLLPKDIDKFYKKYPKACLLPITRYGLKEESIILGDYFGFLNNKMSNFLIGRERYKAVLIIDEAHLVPRRTHEYLSSNLPLELTLRKMRKEINQDIIIDDKKTHDKLEQGIGIVEKMYKSAVEQIKKVSKKGDCELRWSYTKFMEDYNNCRGENELSFEEFMELLDKATKMITNETKQDEESKLKITKFYEFFNTWRERHLDKDYSEYFKFYEYKNGSKRKVDEIDLRVVCKNPSSFLTELFDNWKKIILISGTLPKDNYFMDMLGLKNFKVDWQTPLKSYSIKENILIYPKGDFKSTKRKTTYNDNKDTLNKVIENLDGKTIIYIQSQGDSDLLCKQIKSKETIDFCKFPNDNGELEKVDKNKFEELKSLFLSKKEAVAIMGINGRVEGQNFLDENGKTVDNIIIYGYPYKKRDIEYDDMVDYWKKELGNKQEAEKYVEYRPNASKLYQAVMRSKRKKEDNPIILLWGNPFSKNNPAYEYLYDELKGKMIYEEIELINSIKKVNNERKNIIQ